MLTTKNDLLDNIVTLISESLGEEVSLDDISQSLYLSSKHAHFSFKPFLLAKRMKRSPKYILEKIVQNIDRSYFKSLSIENNFLNMTLESKVLNQAILESTYNFKNNKSVMIEYSQPNTHKQLHVGHMRNLCLGNTLVNMQRFVGNKVTSVTYPGDIGTHVAKSLYYIKNVEKTLPKKNQGEWLADIYVKATKYEKENNIKKDITNILEELLNESGEYFELWKITREWSLDLMKSVYDWANVSFDYWFYESSVDKESVSLVKKLYQEGKLVKDKGAIGMYLDELGFCLLLKEDGTGLYSTKDLLLSYKKFEYFSIDESIYLVDNRQTVHFNKIFKVLENLEFEKVQNCKHLSYEMVELPGGAMKSREGNIVPISHLIESMEEKIIKDYLSHWKEDEQKRVAKQISNAAIKYGMVSIDSNKKIVFDMDEWLKLDGETGPYLQYTAVRMKSLLKESISDKIDYSLLDSSFEEDLVLALYEFSDVIVNGVNQYKASYLCKYLYKLCKLFNSFYANCPILKENQNKKNARLALVKKTNEVLEIGLELLGIEIPERM